MSDYSVVRVRKRTEKEKRGGRGKQTETLHMCSKLVLNLLFSCLGLPNGEIAGNVSPHESSLRGLSRGLVRIGRQRSEGLKFSMFILIGPNKSYI